MHTYMESNTNIYKTFWPFQYITFFLCSGLIWYIISTNVPLHFNNKKLSFGISICKYAPGTSKSIPPYASTTCVVNNPFRETVGRATLSSYFKCIFRLHFSFVRFTDSSALLLSIYVSSSVSDGITTGFPEISPSYNCLNSFIIAAIAFSANNLIPFFAYIFVKITFAAACMYACAFYYSSSQIISSFIVSVSFHAYRCSWDIVVVYSYSCMNTFPRLVVVVPLLFHNFLCLLFTNSCLIHNSAYIYRWSHLLSLILFSYVLFHQYFFLSTQLNCWSHQWSWIYYDNVFC